METPSLPSVSDHGLLPRWARTVVLWAVGSLLVLGAYLAWVRGPAMLLDLAGSAFRAMCF